MSIGSVTTEAVAITVEKDGPTVSGNFAAPDLFGWLEAATPEELDALPFGLITMMLDGTVAHYNAVEAKLAGLRPERVVGRNFFTSVAPCTDNFMIAHRYRSECELDVVIDYVFAFRLMLRKVRLRLMKRPDGRHMYLALQARD